MPGGRGRGVCHRGPGPGVTGPSTPPAERAGGLGADCGRCSALCCVAPVLTRSADFAIDKPGGQPCPNLGPGFRCTVHSELRERGFAGCTAFDCFGAGPRVSQETFPGRHWRGDPAVAQPMFAAFWLVLQLHELLWYLDGAARLPVARPLRAELTEAYAELDRVAGGTVEELAAVRVGAHRGRVDVLLGRVSELVRAQAPQPSRDLRRADLIGASLAGADLRGAQLRGAQLIGADLRGADLRLADLIGADLRGADLGGADLSSCVFLTASQVGSARGDSTTRLPHRLAVPPHWSA